ncbi:MAG: hypothetical protein HY958_07880 [Bacteroidia bacterium]|nr:hypothetical protein [Bacteroidia bacterium]
MTKKKTYKSKPAKKQEAKEPASPYKGMKITFCSSFEEMNEHQYMDWLELTPELRIAQATFMAGHLWADTIQAGTKTRKIIFKQA